jgi:hypothetical protein
MFKTAERCLEIFSLIPIGPVRTNPPLADLVIINSLMPCVLQLHNMAVNTHRRINNLTPKQWDGAGSNRKVGHIHYLDQKESLIGIQIY